MGASPARRSTSARPRLRSTAGRRLEQAERAAQHVLADQRRRRRQAGRKLHAAVVERLATAEWPKAIVVTRAPGRVASLPPWARTSRSRRRRVRPCRRPTRKRVCPARGNPRLRPQRAALRAAVLRAAGLRAGRLRPAPRRRFLLGARGRRASAPACRLRFSASMMSTTLPGSAASGTAKLWPACLARSMATTASS